MSVKTYQLYCEICGFKRITDGSDCTDLVEIKQGTVPRGIPFYDVEKKTIVTPEPMPKKKKFKCPKCGRVVMARKLNEQQNNQPDGCEASSEGQPVPGQLASGTNGPTPEVS